MHARAPSVRIAQNSCMRILVLGGSGGVGRHVLAQAVARGHDVVALVRAGSEVDAPAGVTVVRDDPVREGALEAVTPGREVVVSSLGIRRGNPLNPWSPILGPHDFASAVARRIVAAMRAAGVPKVVAVSTAGVADSGPRMNWPMQLAVATSNVGVGYRDLAVMERVYAESGLDVCCVRPVRLTDGPATGRIRVVDRFGLFMTIPRADVATFLLDRAEQPVTDDRFPQIASA